MPDLVTVIGGTGRTGRHAVRKLRDRGIAVRVLSRHPAALPEGVELVAGDLTDLADVRRAMTGADAVIITANTSSDQDDDPNGPTALHVTGTQNILAAAAPSAHLVQIGMIYTERGAEHPEFGVIIDARRTNEALLRDSGRPYTVVRAAFLSDEPGGSQGLRLEQGDTGEGNVSREDVAEACVQAVLADEARGKTFELYNEPGTPPTDWPRRFAALDPDPAPARS
jgi:uncharacterized protein YbjT (DUF2867 family)